MLFQYYYMYDMHMHDTKIGSRDFDQLIHIYSIYIALQREVSVEL